MRRLIALMFAFMAAVAVMPQASAQEADGITLWTNPGGDPYASTDKEAMEKLPLALPALAEALKDQERKLPESVRAKALAYIAAKPEGDEVVYIPPNKVFDAMMYSPAGKVERNVKLPEIAVKFKGRDGMVLSAKARVWRIEEGGYTYIFYEPFICHNWAVDIVETIPPPPPQEDCATVTYRDITVGMTYHVAVLAQGSLSPSVCWARKEGSGEWEVWPDDCPKDCVWDHAQAYVLEHRKVSTKVRQSGKSVATATEITLRVPLSVARRDFIVVCVDDHGKPSREKYVEPDDFKGSADYVAKPLQW